MKKIDYKPHDPKGYRPGIGIIGCGNIVRNHLAAYKKANYRIVAMADINIDNLKDRARQVPGVKIFTDYNQLLKLPEVKVVDIATHPEERVQLVRDALNSGKHVLSQKPFVLDLKVGEELAKLAAKKKLLLAVNQNGRWNPPWNYAYQVIQAGMIGKVMSVHMCCHWDHNGIRRNPKFNKLQHIVLYDYGIHWFDILAVWMGNKQAKRVFASFSKAPNQKAAPPLLAQALIEYEGAQASLVFDGSQNAGGEDSFFIGGTKGSILCTGP
ncbi:MAG: Gfo/Idh/MocA family oxidoreductase, partial [Candidatus Omnitrophica bacterium]|nr:Gfo/Idh/MocA family oxidoreductase [Candidatus Omnitrophota bacterium]